MIKCKKCNEEKPADMFYVSDYGSCKECKKSSARASRLANIDKVREYDRRRGVRQPSTYFKAYRQSNPNKYRATNMVNNAIRDGKLFREPCTVCGAEKTVGHHDDYLKPLNVKWLCQAHHKQWHRDNGEGLNG